MKKCPKCGTETLDTAFCRGCGENLVYQPHEADTPLPVRTGLKAHQYLLLLLLIVGGALLLAGILVVLFVFVILPSIAAKTDSKAAVDASMAAKMSLSSGVVHEHPDDTLYAHLLWDVPPA